MRKKLNSIESTTFQSFCIEDLFFLIESCGSMMTVVAVVETFIAPVSLERKVEPALTSLASKCGRAHRCECECESPHREAFAALKSFHAESRRKEEPGRKREWRRQRNSFGRRELSSGQATADARSHQMGICPIGMGPPHSAASLFASIVYTVQSCTLQTRCRLPVNLQSYAICND